MKNQKTCLNLQQNCLTYIYLNQKKTHRLTKIYPIKKKTINFTEPSHGTHNFNSSSFLDIKSDKMSFTAATHSNHQRTLSSNSFALQTTLNEHQFSRALQEIDSNIEYKNFKTAAPTVVISPSKRNENPLFNELTFNKEKIEKLDRYEFRSNLQCSNSRDNASSNIENLLYERTPKNIKNSACDTNNRSDVQIGVHDINLTQEEENCDTASFKSCVLYDSGKHSDIKNSAENINIGMCFYI
jgi:hypothetical protein